MNYTLDSITHVVTCLQQENAGSEIRYTPHFTNDLSTLTASYGRMYFGILTNGKSGELNLKGFDTNTFISIQEDSQIIELFMMVHHRQPDSWPT